MLRLATLGLLGADVPEVKSQVPQGLGLMQQATLYSWKRKGFLLRRILIGLFKWSHIGCVPFG